MKLSDVSEESILKVGLFATFILPVIGFFFRTGFLGYDSYYFLKEVCGGNSLFGDSLNPLANILISALPCNEIFLKLVLVLFFWGSLLAIYAIGSLFGKKEGIMLTLFAGITPIIMNNSFKFENDSFAFPIMFFGVYFFLKYLLNEKKNKIDLIASIGLIGIATLFWGGAIYYLFPFTLAEPLLLIITIPIFLAFSSLLLTQLMPRLQVAENHPVKGAINFMFYIAFIMFGSGKKIIDFYFPLITTFFILLGFINPKFMILGIPFYALFILKIWQSATPTNKKIILLFAITLNIAWGATLFFHTTSPLPGELIASQEIVEYSEQTGKTIKNDWGFGHLIRYYGGETAYHSTFPNIDLNGHSEAVILSRNEIECEIIKQYDDPILAPPLILYNC